jgi:hypothetical protein
MRISVAALAILALVVVVRSPAAGATARDALEKRVAKYATADPAKPKSLCYCQSGQGEVGYVVRQAAGGSFVTVACSIPVFSAGGEFIQYSPCAVDWYLLSK